MSVLQEGRWRLDATRGWWLNDLLQFDWESMRLGVR